MCTMLCLFVWDGLGSKLQISAAETRFVRLIAPVRYRDQSHHRAFFLFFFFFFWRLFIFVFRLRQSCPPRACMSTSIIVNYAWLVCNIHQKCTILTMPSISQLLSGQAGYRASLFQSIFDLPVTAPLIVITIGSKS